jgi:hypothetical protein
MICTPKSGAGVDTSHLDEHNDSKHSVLFQAAVIVLSLSM